MKEDDLDQATVEVCKALLYKCTLENKPEELRFWVSAMGSLITEIYLCNDSSFEEYKTMLNEMADHYKSKWEK